MKQSGMPPRTKPLKARTSPSRSPQGAVLRSPLLPCGPRFATAEKAASSARGQQDGASVRKCWSTACGGFHVVSPPVPVKAVPVPKPHRETGFPASVKLAVRKRAGNREVDEARCESCGVWLGRYGGQIQHRLARKAGGSRSAVVNGVSNGALLCGTPFSGCHGKAEARDEDMRARGWWIKTGKGLEHDPRYIPVMVMSAAGAGATVFLDADGGYSSAPPAKLAAA